MLLHRISWEVPQPPVMWIVRANYSPLQCVSIISSLFCSGYSEQFHRMSVHSLRQENEYQSLHLRILGTISHNKCIPFGRFGVMSSCVSLTIRRHITGRLCTYYSLGRNIILYLLEIRSNITDWVSSHCHIGSNITLSPTSDEEQYHRGVCSFSGSGSSIIISSFR